MEENRELAIVKKIDSDHNKKHDHMINSHNKRFNRNSAKAIIIQQRRKDAFELKIQGFSYREIAIVLEDKYKDKLPKGYDSRTVWKDIDEEFKKIQVGVQAEARIARMIELERLDKMFLVVYDQALGGSLKATDRALKIMERRAKLLGLDQPNKITVKTWQNEVIDLIRQGTVTLDEVRQQFGEEAVSAIIESGDIKFIEGSFVEKEGGEEAAGNDIEVDSGQVAE